MKKIFFWIMILIITMLVGCNPTDTTDEEITYEGLDEAHFYIGETVDLFDGVSFTSSTQGDITSTVQTISDFDGSQLGVYIISYQTHYENGDLFSVDRRIVILYPPFTDEQSDNLLANGDFTGNLNNWGVCRYADYPDSVNFIIDPDLKRLQIIMESASTMLASPNLYQTNLVLESGLTYEVSLLVSGTEYTFFSIDFVELDQNFQVLETLLDTQTINVGIQDGEMQLIQFTFSPLTSSSNASFRIMFGQDDGNSPSGEIYIDNVVIVAIS